MPEQGRLFVRAGHRDAELLLAAKTQRGLGEVLEDVFDFTIVHDFPANEGWIRAIGSKVAFFVLGDELQSTHTIAPDLREQTVRVGAVRTDLFRDPPSELVRIRQQVFKDGNHHRPLVGVFAQRQRKRDGNGLVPAQPARIVTKADRPAGVFEQMPDEAVIEQNAQRKVLKFARHLEVAFHLLAPGF